MYSFCNHFSVPTDRLCHKWRGLQIIRLGAQWGRTILEIFPGKLRDIENDEISSILNLRTLRCWGSTASCSSHAVGDELMLKLFCHRLCKHRWKCTVWLPHLFFKLKQVLVIILVLVTCVGVEPRWRDLKKMQGKQKGHVIQETKSSVAENYRS